MRAPSSSRQLWSSRWFLEHGPQVRRECKLAALVILVFAGLETEPPAAEIDVGHWRVRISDFTRSPCG